MSQAGEYVMGGGLTEGQRLLKQGETVEKEARWLLDRLGVRPGSRVVDIGCGPLGILDLLAERVGPEGEVVGLEREPGFIEMARALVAERNLANVRLVQGDASATDLRRESFDLVHERLVLIQQPDPERMLAEMVALTRPGGVIAVQDIDEVSWLCEPPHPAWAALQGAFRTVFSERGLDVFFGRRLPGLLRISGLVDVDAEVHVRLDRPGEYRRKTLLERVGVLRSSLIKRGLFTQEEFDNLIESLGHHLDDPGTTVVRALLFQAWGRKPLA